MRGRQRRRWRWWWWWRMNCRNDTLCTSNNSETHSDTHTHTHARIYWVVRLIPNLALKFQLYLYEDSQLNTSLFYHAFQMWMWHRRIHSITAASVTLLIKAWLPLVRISKILVKIDSVHLFRYCVWVWRTKCVRCATVDFRFWGGITARSGAGLGDERGSSILCFLHQ